MSDIDLTQYDEDFQRADVREQEFEAVPDGKYQVAVDRVELTRARSSGNPMLKWALRILGPNHAGRLLWRNNVMGSAENMKWLKTDLHICGLELQKLSDLPASLDRLVGVTLEITKRTKGDNENVYFNRRITREDEGSYQDAARDALTPF